MKKIYLFIIGLILGATISGCGKEYLDPQFGILSYEDIPQPLGVYEFNAKVKNQVNGKPFQGRYENDRSLTKYIEGSIQHAGFYINDNSDAACRLIIITNRFVGMGDILNPSSAELTVYTFGLIPYKDIDNYEVVISLSINGQHVMEGVYRHRIINIAGLIQSHPKGVQFIEVNSGYRAVIEQAILKFFLEIQKKVATDANHLLEACTK